MCGIFGYYYYHNPAIIGKILNLTIDGLKRLEYRGYDSSGVCITDTTGSNIIIKTVGNVSQLTSHIKNNDYIQHIYSNINQYGSCIAHTRWATHGPPSNINAHPHVSCKDNTFVVVHNGIITNYNKLKNMLKRAGFVFQSMTDTEVIPKLFMFIYNKLQQTSSKVTFIDIIINSLRMLEGTFAILVKSSLYPTEIVACKKGSPLIVGLMKVLNGYDYIFSSDISAIIDHTNNVINLDDNEIFNIYNGEYTVLNFKTNKYINRICETINVNKNDVLKGKYNTYMEKEIFEQPITLQKTMYGRINNNIIHIDELIPYKDKIINASRIILIACGTSHNACLGSRMMVENLISIPIAVECASDFMDRNYCLRETDVCIFVSQSGETADTLYALQYAKSKNVFTVSITNKPDSSIARQSDISINLNAGFEISVASTKAYTSQLLMFVLIAMELTNNKYKLNINELPSVISETIQMTNEVVAFLSREVVKYTSILFIGRGNNYATALESALKVKEIAYIHSEGILAGELKHGPLALLDDRVLTFVFVTHDTLYEKMISVIEQLNARRAKIIAICNNDDLIVPKMVPEKNIIKVPKVNEYLQHIVNAIPMQLLAYNLASIQGHNVDQPRNLAKSVTVTD